MKKIMQWVMAATLMCGMVAFAQQRCHVLIQTCDHPGGHTAETCIFCKH